MESGFRIKVADHYPNSSRNESIVLSEDGEIFEVNFILAVLDKQHTYIEEAYASCFRLLPVVGDDAPLLVGSRSIPVVHVFCVNRSDQIFFLKLNEIYRQLIILKQIGNSLLISVPSSMYRTT